MGELNQRHNRREPASLDDCDIESCASFQSLQIQKNQLFELLESLERFCNYLLVFGFNSAKYYLETIKSYSLLIQVNERDIEHTVIKIANQLISFKIGDIHSLEITNFFCGATSLDIFLKAYKTSKISTTNGLIIPTNC